MVVLKRTTKLNVEVRKVKDKASKDVFDLKQWAQCIELNYLHAIRANYPDVTMAKYPSYIAYGQVNGAFCDLGEALEWPMMERESSLDSTVDDLKDIVPSIFRLQFYRQV